MLEGPTITTRVVLTEKIPIPFWVDVFYDGGESCGTYLVKKCLSEEDDFYSKYATFVSEDFDDININCYIIIGPKNEDKGLFVRKINCKRVNKR